VSQFTSITRRIAAGLVALVAVVGLSVASAAPASAATSTRSCSVGEAQFTFKVNYAVLRDGRRQVTSVTSTANAFAWATMADRFRYYFNAPGTSADFSIEVDGGTIPVNGKPFSGTGTWYGKTDNAFPFSECTTTTASIP
jgi:hypothetical protein